MEGQPPYGEIGTSLTTEGDTGADSGLAVERFPGGPSNEYERTFELNEESAQSVRDGTGVDLHGGRRVLGLARSPGIPARAVRRNCGCFGMYLTQRLSLLVLAQDALLLVYAVLLFQDARKPARGDRESTRPAT